MATDEDQIRQLMTAWRERTVAGDLDGVLALMTDDVVFLTAGNPPMSKRDFASGFSQMMKGARFESTQDVKEIVVSGDLAYARSYIAVVVSPPDGGAVIERAGHVLTVLRKSPAGAWLLARDANLMGSGGTRS